MAHSVGLIRPQETGGSAAFTRLVKCMGAGGGRSGALAEAERAGADRRVVGFLKAPVPSASLAESDWAGDLASLGAGFISSIRPRSLFYFAASLVPPVPWRGRTNVMTLLESGERNEGGFVRVTGGPDLLDAVDPEPVSVASLIVATRELWEAATAAAFQRLQRELEAGSTKVVDEKFWTIIASGADVTSATDDVLGNMRQALDSVNLTGGGGDTCFWAASVDTANALATTKTLAGNRLFETMTPFGGTVLGLPCLVSDAVPSGCLMLIQTASLALNAGTIDVSYADQTTLEFADASTMSSITPTPKQMISLWQTNCRAIRVIHRFVAEKARDSAVAMITNCANAWGDAQS